MSGVLAILGAGPHGHELADIAARCGYQPLFFDDDPDLGHGTIQHYTHLTFSRPGAPAPYVVGAAWPQVRRQIRRQVQVFGAATLIDPDASIIGTVQLGPGVAVAAGARITTGAKIGNHTHVNLNATVSRGCDIGAFVTICPGVNISGGVIVEDDVFIGVGAVIKHELVIGQGALIGAGAVVVEDVKPFEIMVGNPARPR